MPWVVSAEPTLSVCFIGKRTKGYFLVVLNRAVRVTDTLMACLMNLDQFLSSQQVGAKEKCWLWGMWSAQWHLSYLEQTLHAAGNNADSQVSGWLSHNSSSRAADRGCRKQQLPPCGQGTDCPESVGSDIMGNCSPDCFLSSPQPLEARASAWASCVASGGPSAQIL